MSVNLVNNSGVSRSVRNRKSAQGGAQNIVLVLVCFLLGAGLSAFWFSRAARDKSETGQPSATLSEPTRAALQQLSAPVEVRFYSVLDAATVSPAVQAYAGRIGDLLSEYERESGGKFKLTRVAGGPDFAPESAHADGLTPFNMDKGDACYLGIALAQGARKESLPYLAPEWENALESDLTRALGRVCQPAQQQSGPISVRVDPAAVDTVKKTLPNLDAITLEEGTRLLREAALKDFTTTAQQLQAQIKEAEQKVIAAQGAQSEAEKQAALKQLQELQAQQAEKLKQVAANSKAQIDALQQLKAGAK